MSRVVTGVDTLLGKIYNSLGFSRMMWRFAAEGWKHRGMIKIISSFLCMYL
jgi:predicted GNAT family N-acyltransferase